MKLQLFHGSSCFGRSGLIGQVQQGGLICYVKSLLLLTVAQEKGQSPMGLWCVSCDLGGMDGNRGILEAYSSAESFGRDLGSRQLYGPLFLGNFEDYTLSSTVLDQKAAVV